MIYIRAVLAVIVAGALISWGFWLWRENSFPSTAEDRLNLMDQMEKQGIPEIKGVDLQGQKITSRDYIAQAGQPGKIVIVNFWASWCAPCLEEFPSMIKLVQEMKGRVVLLAVSQDSTRQEIEAFLKSFPEAKTEGVHVIWDEDRGLGKAYEVDRLPESFLAGPEGKLITKVVGTINWYSPDTIAYLNDILAKANK